MRAGAIAAVLAAMAILVGVPPSVAAAAAHRVKEDASTYVEVEGRAARRFSFNLFVLDEHFVELSLEKSDVSGKSGFRSESVTYSRQPETEVSAFENGVLDVRLGDRGHFHAEFVPSSTKKEGPGRNCKGGPRTTEEGSFVGSFVFHGERGYTAIKAAKEKGVVSRQGKAVCTVRSEGGAHHPTRQERQERKRERTTFRLVAGGADARLSLQASRVAAPTQEGLGSTTFAASASGGMLGDFSISRTAAVIDIRPDSASTFLTPDTSEPLAEATLEPPAPFSDRPRSASSTRRRRPGPATSR